MCTCITCVLFYLNATININLVSYQQYPLRKSKLIQLTRAWAISDIKNAHLKETILHRIRHIMKHLTISAIIFYLCCAVKAVKKALTRGLDLELEIALVLVERGVGETGSGSTDPPPAFHDDHIRPWEKRPSKLSCPHSYNTRYVFHVFREISAER